MSQRPGPGALTPASRPDSPAGPEVAGLDRYCKQIGMAARRAGRQGGKLLAGLPGCGREGSGMPGVGLQLLPMTAAESSPWGSCPFPQPMLCYTCRSGTRDFVFCVWEETLSASCGYKHCKQSSRAAEQLWVTRCLVVRLGAALCPPRVRPGRVPAWADGRMTSVEQGGVLQMPRYHTRCWTGLGWGLGFLCL